MVLTSSLCAVGLTYTNLANGWIALRLTCLVLQVKAVSAEALKPAVSSIAPVVAWFGVCSRYGDVAVVTYRGQQGKP